MSRVDVNIHSLQSAAQCGILLALMPPIATVAALAIIAFFMLVFVLILAMFAFGCWRVWVALNFYHQYKDLIAQAEQQQATTPGPSTGPDGRPLWTIKYKSGKKSGAVVMRAATEQLALLEVVKNGNLRYDQIISITKN